MESTVRKIAVCTDFTSIAQHAFEESLDLARLLEAEVHLIHVLLKDEETQTTAEQRLVDMVRKASDRSAGIDIKFHVTENYEGDIVETLNDIIDKMMPTYFVVGYEIKSGLDRFFGPSLMRIARQTKYPVIAIKEDENLRQMKRIVFPLNLWEYARQKIYASMRLARDLNASIDLVGLSVNNSKEDDRKLKIYLSQCEEQFQKNDIPFKTVILTGDNEVNLVIDYANNQDADMIAKVFHHDPGLIDRVMGNQDEELLAKTNMPLFIVKSNSYMSGSWSTMGGG